MCTMNPDDLTSGQRLMAESRHMGVEVKVAADKLDRLEAENAKLREQMERLTTLLRVDHDIDASWDGLRHFWTIGLTENGCLMRDRAFKAEAENAKLRELADAVKEFVEDTHCEDCPCRRDCYDNNHIFCASYFSYHAFAAMRELGIEV